jgi:hypothetical protein
MHDGTQVNKDILQVALALNKGEYSTETFKSFFGYELVWVESTEEDHPANEDAFYKEADDEYRDSQSDIPIGDVLQALEQKAKVVVYFRQS